MFNDELIFLKLIKEYRANEPGNLLAKYEVHVMPIVNADGYEYAHNTVLCPHFIVDYTKFISKLILFHLISSVYGEKIDQSTQAALALAQI